MRAMADAVARATDALSLIARAIGWQEAQPEAFECASDVIFG